MHPSHNTDEQHQDLYSLMKRLLCTCCHQDSAFTASNYPPSQSAVLIWPAGSVCKANATLRPAVEGKTTNAEA